MWHIFLQEPALQGVLLAAAILIVCFGLALWIAFAGSANFAPRQKMVGDPVAAAEATEGDHPQAMADARVAGGLSLDHAAQWQRVVAMVEQGIGNVRTVANNQAAATMRLDAVDFALRQLTTEFAPVIPDGARAKASKISGPQSIAA